MVIKMTSMSSGPNSIWIALATNFFEVIWTNSVGKVAGICCLYYLNDIVN